MAIIQNPQDISANPMSAFLTLRACAACCANTDDNGWGVTASGEHS